MQSNDLCCGSLVDSSRWPLSLTSRWRSSDLRSRFLPDSSVFDSWSSLFLRRNMVPSNLIEATFQQVNATARINNLYKLKNKLLVTLCVVSPPHPPSTEQTWFPSLKSQPEPYSPTLSTSSPTRTTPKVGRCTWSWLRLRISRTRQVRAAASRWMSSASSSSPPPWVSRMESTGRRLILRYQILMFSALTFLLRSNYFFCCLYFIMDVKQIRGGSLLFSPTQ